MVLMNIVATILANPGESPGGKIKWRMAVHPTMNAERIVSMA